MKCPRCGDPLDEDNYCSYCMQFFDESELKVCPHCGNQLDEDDFCSQCMEFIHQNDNSNNDYGFGEQDYDSMVNNGDNICLNCTYWSVSPYGAAYGMICRRGYPTDGPGDSCGDFVQSHSFANYGDAGQYQFDETSRDISNKLNYWKNSR